jgi:hypothetical protein
VFEGNIAQTGNRRKFFLTRYWLTR